MHRLRRMGMVAAFAAALLASGTALAYTDKEIEDLFHKLDTDGDGKISQVEYDVNKVAIIYRRAEPNKQLDVTFEQTRVTREFFDAADVDHDGKLSPVEVIDALAFEKLDTDHKGYLTYDDFYRFMKRIGR